PSVASKATLLAVVVALTIDTRTAKWRVDNARPAKPPADHSRCGAPGSRAHVRVLARRRAGMDPAATRGLRTGRDPALPPAHLRRSRSCMSHYRRYLTPACRAVFDGSAKKKKARRSR